MILWAVQWWIGDTGFRHGRYCGHKTCRPVENVSTVPADADNECVVGDNNCLWWIRAIFWRAKANLLVGLYLAIRQ